MIVSLNTSILAKIASPKHHKKGDTEERIYADNQRARTTAKLMSELPVRRSLDSKGGEDA